MAVKGWFDSDPTDLGTELSVEDVRNGVWIQIDAQEAVVAFAATPEQAVEIAQELLDTARVVRQRQRGDE